MMNSSMSTNSCLSVQSWDEISHVIDYGLGFCLLQKKLLRVKKEEQNILNTLCPKIFSFHFINIYR